MSAVFLDLKFHKDLVCLVYTCFHHAWHLENSLVCQQYASSIYYQLETYKCFAWDNSMPVSVTACSIALKNPSRL